MVFGTHTAILGADAMLACSARIVASYGDPRLVNCLAQILEQTVSGQISEMDSLWRISEDVGEYLQIIRSKTAWTIRGSCELGALRAGAQGAELEAIMEYGLAVGMAFQIIDDALDFAPSEKTGKPEGGDLREGKATPPLLLYLDSLPGEERAHISALFTQRLLQREEADNIARNIRKHGFDAATRTMADAYLEKAEQALKILSGLVQEQEYALLSQAISYVRNRES
jgi:octaprenyl-diphosphate synthase